MTTFFQHKGDTGANKGNSALNEHNSTARTVNMDWGVDLLLHRMLSHEAEKYQLSEELIYSAHHDLIFADSLS